MLGRIGRAASFRRLFLSAAAFAALALPPEVALAQPADSAIIGGHDHQRSAGNIGVNAAAGNNNQQANAAAIPLGATRSATGIVLQRPGATSRARNRPGTKLIACGSSLRRASWRERLGQTVYRTGG